MIQMRKALLLALTCGMLLAGAACGGKKDDLPKATPTSAGVPASVVTATALTSA